jgi:peptidoglycan/LPS O-acetylase OafA/YrhL
LRALAAGSVLVYLVWLHSIPMGHAPQLGLLSWFMFSHLALGVTLFFMLLGFLLYRTHVAMVLRRGPAPGVLRYARNRALRKLPAYWVVLGCTKVCCQPRSSGSRPRS